MACALRGIGWTVLYEPTQPDKRQHTEDRTECGHTTHRRHRRAASWQHRKWPATRGSPRTAHSPGVYSRRLASSHAPHHTSQRPPPRCPSLASATPAALHASSRARACSAPPRTAAQCVHRCRSRAGPRPPRLGRPATVWVGALPLHQPPPPPPTGAPAVAVARPGGASRTICSACDGARAWAWAHWSIGPRIAAQCGRVAEARAWAVRTGRARDTKGPVRFTRAHSRLQAARRPLRATLGTR